MSNEQEVPVELTVEEKVAALPPVMSSDEFNALDEDVKTFIRAQRQSVQE